MKDDLFPTIKKSLTDLINDEEGNIPRSKLVVMGSTIMLMGMIMGMDVFSAHRSHVSHRSHSSTSYHRSHVSHTSHRSHSSGSHNSHSNSSHSAHSSHGSGGGSSHSSSSGASAKAKTSHSNNLPKASQIPVPKKPVDDSFTGAIPKISISATVNPGVTQKPKV